MLAELSIFNFGIIESVNLSFDKGLTVITGETGAGKSMIIDAIGLLAGGRGSVDFVRHGAEKAEIEGLFYIESSNPCYEKLEDLGIQSDDQMVVLRREMLASGKSVCRINGKLITLSVMKDIGRMLIDIHGQHEHQDLLQADRHLSLLDSYGGESQSAAFLEYRNQYEKYRTLQQRFNHLSENEKEAAQRLDMIRFQVEEIDALQLEEAEDDQLESEKLKLANFEKVFDALQEGYQALNGDQRGLEWIGKAMNAVEGIVNFDDSYNKMHESVADHYYLLEELSFSMRDAFEQLEYDPDRLNVIEERLNDIQKLKRKYGDTVADILRYRNEAAEELESLANRDVQLETIRKELAAKEKELVIAGERLSSERKKTAVHLIKSIKRELQDLQMPKTEFDISFSKGSNDRSFHKDGIDEIAFLISTNPGEPMKRLVKVASGGELSRIMLALKSIFSDEEGVTSIIFDEVDTGVSGRAAQAMAEKIFHLSAHSQVFCITHLPQVAAMADIHLYIVKAENKKRTTTVVHELKQDERIDEVGRMISGTAITDLTKQHAKELLELATQMKATS